MLPIYALPAPPAALSDDGTVIASTVKVANDEGGDSAPVTVHAAELPPGANFRVHGQFHEARACGARRTDSNGR
jgi:hypothetical protein